MVARQPLPHLWGSCHEVTEGGYQSKNALTTKPHHRFAEPPRERGSGSQSNKLAHQRLNLANRLNGFSHDCVDNLLARQDRAHPASRLAHRKARAVGV
jgi:hypothetical protein